MGKQSISFELNLKTLIAFIPNSDMALIKGTSSGNFKALHNSQECGNKNISI